MEKKRQLTKNERDLIAMVDYLVVTNVMAVNAILYKYGYPATKNVQEIRSGILELLGDKRIQNDVLRDLSRVSTPLRKLMKADIIDSKDSTYSGEYEDIYPKDTINDRLTYDSYPIRPEIVNEYAMPRTQYERYLSNVISGRNYSGDIKPDGSGKMNILVVLFILFMLIYLIGKE